MRISFGRLAIALLVFVAGLEAVALWRGGSGLFGTGAVRWGGDVEGPPVGHVAGTAWRFDAPSGAWYTSRRIFPGFEDDPDARVEKVLARPEGDAVACLVSRRTPGGGGFDSGAAADEISKVWASRFRAYQFHEIAPLPGRGVRVLHVSARIEGGDFEALWALYPSGPRTYAFMAGAPAREFPLLRGELESLLASFQSDVASAEPAPTLTYIQKSFSDIREIEKKRPRP